MFYFTTRSEYHTHSQSYNFNNVNKHSEIKKPFFYSASRSVYYPIILRNINKIQEYFNLFNRIRDFIKLEYHPITFNNINKNSNVSFYE